ncbi:ABC transporter ATP-binding protein [Thalassobius sp. MITS945101]|uniref:ABC transporter ATP-binding protein n=1 Tax=Thalassobius sp. MITS945101 TaxID=3096994 RepID=UPI0039998C2F
MPTIKLTSVDKQYDKSSPVKAVDDLNLEIGDGEFMCLLGPSGCGKTTTLRMIAGLENLSEGAIQVGERLVDSANDGVFVPPEKRGMGLVFQSYALWPHLTIERNTDFGLRLRKVPKAEREERVNHVMKTLGIEQYRDRYPSQLSGGQQQRVALARMLAVNPEVLLLDEPLSNLDARLRLEMRAELKRIHSAFGTTIVFVTHDQWEAMTLATQIAVMNQGTLQQVGTPEDIYDRPANRFVAEFVGSPPINIIEMHDGGDAGLRQALRAHLQGDYADGAEIASVGLRPENIQIAASPAAVSDSDFQRPMVVTAVLPTGGSWIVEMEDNGNQLFATTNQPPVLNAGDKGVYSLAPGAMHSFDGKGVRLQPLAEEASAKQDVREAG